MFIRKKSEVSKFQMTKNGWLATGKSPAPTEPTEVCWSRGCLAKRRPKVEHFPDAPCIVYLPTWLGDFVRANVGIHVPYMEHMDFLPNKNTRVNDLTDVKLDRSTFLCVSFGKSTNLFLATWKLPSKSQCLEQTPNDFSPTSNLWLWLYRIIEYYIISNILLQHIYIYTHIYIYIYICMNE